MQDGAIVWKSAALGEHGGFGYSRLSPGRGGGQLGEGRVYLSTGSFAPLPTPPQNEACGVVPWPGECLGRGTSRLPGPRDHCHHHKQQRGEGLALKFRDGSIRALLGLA